MAAGTGAAHELVLWARWAQLGLEKRRTDWTRRRVSEDQKGLVRAWAGNRTRASRVAVPAPAGSRALDGTDRPREPKARPGASPVQTEALGLHRASRREDAEAPRQALAPAGATGGGRARGLKFPFHLSDWLLLQTPQMVFLEGETIMLRCHSWRSKPLNRVTFYQNGKSVKFQHYSGNFSISKANHSHSGDYHCTGLLGKNKHLSKTVTITVQGSATASVVSLLWYHASFCLVMCLLFAVDTGLYFCVRKNLQPPVEAWRKSLSVRKCQAPQDK
ncbi:low affinity immunoglobulin gamma Fc region receptor III-like [Onychomys torridus]|uniref:low affinity immunoglobulin gamma Fc region receptor III-like n=1 Tax=Onychomys torridus TaxID=38674 RepID=UPI00167FC593|nr:low affinity immunoglobulin gamma Fc region receptor III-like [Onychomys torridus]